MTMKKPAFKQRQAYVLNYTPASGEHSLVRMYGPGATDAVLLLQTEVDTLRAAGHVFTAEQGLALAENSAIDGISWMFSFKHEDAFGLYFFCHGKISDAAIKAATA